MSPSFSCNGEQWGLAISHKGGAPEEYVSVYLYHFSEGSASATFDIGVLDKNGGVLKSERMTHFFNDRCDNQGWGNFIRRSVIFDPSEAVLDDNGTLNVRVLMKEELKPAFVPPNPFTSLMMSIFLDESSSDVCFEVSAPVKEEEGDVVAASDDLFHAHRLVLDTCAPMLSALCGSSDDGEMAVATITDVKPEIFHHLLSYVYGGSVPKDDLRAHAKDIIDAADKFSIVNLKLEAERAYVDSTEITIDNVMDKLLYADAMNCFLLKELAVDFLADNGEEVLDSASFNNLPGHVVKDVLVAITRKKKKAVAEVAFDFNKQTFSTRGLSLMSVSDLRRKMYYMGLDMDGSREAMIEAISNQAIESISDDEIEE